ncbi:MAG: DUF1611 domain-containing protein [Phycisphaerae bacterium]|nr:DUF1611 domain-containing protein [Phycisphaerae bacterium]
MKRRICILTDGYLDLFAAKTAVGLLRYCPDEVVAVLDRQHAGGDLEALVGVGKGVPIVDSLESALQHRPDHLMLGAVFPGGQLPNKWRTAIRDAIAADMDVVNGLHTRLNDDAELAQCAAQAGRKLWDVRACTKRLTVGTGKARQTRARRILTVGTDCNLGKRLTAIELARELARRKLRAEFVPTGQTGVMIHGSGVVVDAVMADFVSGAVEEAVLEHGDADYVVVEGQGALLHPSYSAVTLGLLHGVLPDLLVLCHAPSRKYMRHTDIPIPPLDEIIRLHQAVLQPIHPPRVVAVALNCYGMSTGQRREAFDQAQALTGLPVADPVRTGVAELADAVCAG